MFNEKFIRLALLKGPIEVAWPRCETGLSLFLRTTMPVIEGKPSIRYSGSHDPVWWNNAELSALLLKIYKEAQQICDKARPRARSYCYFRINPAMFSEMHKQICLYWHTTKRGDEWYTNLICIKSSLDASMRRSKGKSSKKFEKLLACLRTAQSRQSPYTPDASLK